MHVKHYKQMAQDNPKQLIDILPTLKPHELTYATEYVGDIQAPTIVKATLLPLLNHPESVVREGVIYGLSKLCGDLEVRKALTDRLGVEESKAIRDCITEALDD